MVPTCFTSLLVSDSWPFVPFAGLLNFLFSLHKCEIEEARYLSRRPRSLTHLCHRFGGSGWEQTAQSPTGLEEKERQLPSVLKSHKGSTGLVQGEADPVVVRWSAAPCSSDGGVPARTSWNRDVSSKWIVFPDLHRSLHSTWIKHDIQALARPPLALTLLLWICTFRRTLNIQCECSLFWPHKSFGANAGKPRVFLSWWRINSRLWNPQRLH